MKRWLVVTAGLAAATRGASVELASTAVLSVSVSAEVITASEDLAPEDSVILQAAVKLTTEARLAVPTGLRATTTPTARPLQRLGLQHFCTRPQQPRLQCPLVAHSARANRANECPL